MFEFGSNFGPSQCGNLSKASVVRRNPLYDHLHESREGEQALKVVCDGAAVDHGLQDGDAARQHRYLVGVEVWGGQATAPHVSLHQQQCLHVRVVASSGRHLLRQTLGQLFV